MIRDWFTRRTDGRSGDISAAARAMALEGVSKDRAKVRARCDKMRADMGLSPAKWPGRA